MCPRRPLDKNDINKMLLFYKEHYPDLDSVMLRFHLMEFRKQYRAVPVFYPEKVYSYIEVDNRDDRKPLFEVAGGASYHSLLSTQAPKFISEKDMVTEWIQDGGHLELLDSPYQDTGTSALENSNLSTIVHPLQLAVSKSHPLKKNGPPKQTKDKL
jgi:hypothetical protein